MKKTRETRLTGSAIRRLGFVVAAGVGIFAAPSAHADVTITTGASYTIDDSNTTRVDTLTTWNETGTLTIEGDGVLQTWPAQNNEVANDAAIVLAGTGGTIALRFNDNDTHFTVNGPITSTATGAQTLAISTGFNGNGDREAVTFYSGIPDVGDASPLALQVAFRCQTPSRSYVSLPGVNTFTGPITLVRNQTLSSGYLTIGGEFWSHNNGSANTPGTGTLGGGSYPGDITLDTDTIFNYLSSASQTLSGAISGSGAMMVGGGGTVTLSGACTISGDTTVKGGSALVLANTGDYTFFVTDGATNKITGDGSATIGGSFTLDTSAVTLAAGSWTLVDVATQTFDPGFTMAGAGWSEASDVWTKVVGTLTWTFTEATGALSVSGPALFTSFGIPGYDGVIDNTLHTIRLVVPQDTDLATLAPTFTLTSGSSNQTSSAVPTPTFADANPVIYTVTGGGTANDYSVTVVLATGIINVSLEKTSPQSDPALIEGPGGGLGERWNQVTSSSASGLLDSVGAATGVGFTQSGGLDGIDQWGSPPLQMLWSGLRVFGLGATFQVKINGLTPGDFYHVYLGSANVNDGQRSKGDWLTPNPTLTSGIQSVDNTAGLITDTWVEGNNYVTFAYVEVDSNGEIVLDGDAADTYRLPLNGFQLVPTGSPAALITSFGLPGHPGVIDQDAKTIDLVVPYGTNLATLAPEFILSSGTSDQTSGSPPSPNFAAQNPATYTITDTDTDPDTVHAYLVTVTVLPQRGTYVIDLGTSPAGTFIVGGTFDTALTLPVLPVGSILRSIAIDSKIESTNNNNFASELAVLLDPTPGTPGGDFSVAIVNGNHFDAAVELAWPSSADGVPPTPLVDTKTDADWLDAGAIDLGTTGLFLGNGYGPESPGAGATWSGTITLTYDLVGGGSDFDTWAAGFLPDDVSDPAGDFDGDGLTNEAERAFGLNPTSAGSVNPITVPLEAGAGTFSYTRRDTSLSGLTYTIWTSTDLDTWTKDTGASEGVITEDGEVETVPVTLTAAAVDGKLFVQVRAH